MVIDQEVNIFDQAVEISKLKSALASTPFLRVNHGHIAMHDYAQREALMLAIEQVFRSDFSSHIDPMPAESFREAMHRPGELPLNPLPQWIKKWAALYTDPPERRYFYKKEEIIPKHPLWPAVETLAKKFQETELNEVLRQTDEDLRKYGNTILRPYWCDEENEFLIHRYLSQHIRVIENQKNPRSPYATVLLGNTYENSINEKKSKIQRAEVWTKNRYAYIEDGNILSSESLSTTRPPLVHCFDKIPDNLSGYYILPVGATLANLWVRIKNDFLDQLGYVLLMQGHGTLVIQGIDDSKVEVGPGRAIQVPAGSDNESSVYYASPKISIADWQKVVFGIIDQIRESVGIPDNLLQVRTGASGNAIIQANAPLAELRKDRAKIFRRIETNLLRTSIDVLQAHDFCWRWKTNPQDWDLSISYNQPPVNLSTTDKISEEKHLLEAGVIDSGDIAFSRYPDRWDSAQEARKELKAKKDTA